MDPRVSIGETSGLIPVRYAGSEASSESGIRLARRTDWQNLGEDLFAGAGQRLLATDAGEYPLLETLVIKFAQPEAAGDSAEISAGSVAPE